MGHTVAPDFIFLQTPASAAYKRSGGPGSTPALGATSLSVAVSPAVLFLILDHELRRTAGQQRVIGALLGVRSEDGSNVIEVNNCFPLVYETKEGDTAVVDRDHLQQMMTLHQRVNPKELLVGWYATGSEPDITAVLLHEEFFAPEVAPHAAVHLVVHTQLQGVAEQLDLVRAYVAQPVGIPGDDENAGTAFVQIPHAMQAGDVEKAALDLIATSSASGAAADVPVESDIHSLERGVAKLQVMLKALTEYSDAVASGARPGNAVLGRFLMDAISEVPKLDRAEFEKVFSKHLQDNIMVVYLANLTRMQLTIADKLYTIASPPS